MTFQVRAARREDRDAWWRMRHALWPDEHDTHAPEIAAYFHGTLKNPLQVLLAIDDKSVAIGFVELSIRNYAEDAETDRVAYLEGWYVEPFARRQGVGRALLDAAEAWARSEGCSEFGSDALIDNDVSAAAHRAFGFAETAQIRTFLKKI
jgi:aminoglycoside 6'-N-acetyltransferase I